MTQKDPAYSLSLPFVGDHGDHAMSSLLKRSFRSIEDWANNPHTTFGSTLISPLFNDQDETNYATTIDTVASGTYKSYTAPHTPITVDRPFRLFMWGLASIKNTDAVAADVKLNLSVTPSWGSEDFGAATGIQYPADGNHYQLDNFRSFVGNPNGIGTITLKWKYRSSSAAPLAATIDRQRMIYAIFYAPDLASASDAETPVRWSPYANSRAAYRFVDAPS